MARVKELLVISGKGGTGKTSIVGAFAVLAENKVLADCDVDAADLHLLLGPTIRETREFYGSKKATIDQVRCVRCGRCAEACRFGAIMEREDAIIKDAIIKDAIIEDTPIEVGDAGIERKRNDTEVTYRVDPISCEGCAVCYHICPEDVITMKDNLSGHWFISDTRYGPLIHARLGIAEDNSGKLVAEVRRQARSIAESQGLNYIITDGPPGIGCPVISSISGVDLALIVTEPTVAGRHDMERILHLARHFDIETMVCINKYDLDEGKTEEIEYYCHEKGVGVAERIPFDEEVVHALVRGLPLIDYGRSRPNNGKGKASKAMRELWEKVSSRLG